MIYYHVSITFFFCAVCCVVVFSDIILCVLFYRLIALVSYPSICFCHFCYLPLTCWLSTLMKNDWTELLLLSFSSNTIYEQPICFWTHHRNNTTHVSIFKWFGPLLLIRSTCGVPCWNFERGSRIFSPLQRKCLLPHSPHFVKHYYISLKYQSSLSCWWNVVGHKN